MIGLSEFDDIGNALEQAVELAQLAGRDDRTAEAQRCAGHQRPGGWGWDPDHHDRDRLPRWRFGASGAINDVVEQLLRSLSVGQGIHLEQRIMTVLYAPDVFAHLAPEDRKGIEPNALAAICELIAGIEHEGDMDEFEAALLQHGKGTVQIKGRRTAKSNMIVGARNASISYSTSHEVYQSIAKALVSNVVDDDVRSRSEKYTINQMGKTVTSEFRITDLAGDSCACASFGYANVSLGAPPCSPNTRRSGSPSWRSSACSTATADGRTRRCRNAMKS